MGNAAEQRNDCKVPGKVIVMKTAAEQEAQSTDGEFCARHIGPQPAEVSAMLSELGASSLDDFIARAVPDVIKLRSEFSLRCYSKGLSEAAALKRAAAVAARNKVFRSFIGMGYAATIVPPVILRNILENPGWYTQYTPYQPEISQGRLEALLNFQTVVADLTGLPIANASMLDEATAAAEAMSLSYGVVNRSARGDKSKARNKYFVSSGCFPQTIAVMKTRAEALDIELVIAARDACVIDESYFGALVQYPDDAGLVTDLSAFAEKAHAAGALLTVAADPLALVLLKSPGDQGADICVGSAQRFGVPVGFGGPHAAFFATRDEYKRVIPGRLVGVSKDTAGNPALRLALQTREQHIRREKATSNICTAQVLLAVMAGMYAVYHGPRGLRKIAERVNSLAGLFAQRIRVAGLAVVADSFFDTVTVKVDKKLAAAILQRAEAAQVNLRIRSETELSVTFDEASTAEDVKLLEKIFTGQGSDSAEAGGATGIGADLLRSDEILTHEVFKKHTTETEFLRYVRRLESRDLSLCQSMIPLGSCTMKLNATSEMLPVTWKEFGELHPFAPATQTAGYRELFDELESSLADITGFAAVSLQPNAGSQGEYAGLLAIREYHKNQGSKQRSICLIPRSAHGTNPASAVMAGMEVVVVDCDQDGNIDVDDLAAKAELYADTLAALMVTYPSTHGVFEARIKEVCDIVHTRGGQVYLDGANLNALVGICKVAEIGADVCHINLHKTFCIPHGGGGPGMGPIGVAAHLAPFLPGHPLVEAGPDGGAGVVSAAPWGSASILPISWMYIMMMGAEGLTRATQVAILNANYIASRLKDYYPVLYRGAEGLVAHECILDLRPLKKATGIDVEDVAKRLMDYGFHAPTVSFPVPGTLMIEPTESESKAELDRFCAAMVVIHGEIKAVESGEADRNDNVLKNAPHTALSVTATSWDHPYSRQEAAFPDEWTRSYKFWPAVGRIDSSYGDRNLICSCPAVEDYV